MSRHKVSIRSPLWDKAKALAELEEMSVSEWVEDVIQEAIDDAGYGDSGPGDEDIDRDSDKED